MTAFTEHPEIQQPRNSDAVVWRYLKHWKFESMLKQRALYFAAVGDLDDAHEGSLPVADYEEIQTNVPDAEQLSQTRREALRRIRVNCWTMQPNESDALWRIYAGEPRSVAIRSTYARLREAVLQPATASVQIGMVQYKNFAGVSASMSRNMLAPVFWKRLPFRYESEVRLAGSFYSTQVYEKPEDYKPNALVGCDLELLMESVVVNPYANPAYRAEVEALLGELAGTIRSRVSKSELDTRPLF